MKTTTSKSLKSTSRAHKSKAEPNGTEQIKILLADLNAEDNVNAKKKIRAKLRRLGHYGASRTADKMIVSKVEAAKLTARAADATDDQGDED